MGGSHLRAARVSLPYQRPRVIARGVTRISSGICGGSAIVRTSGIRDTAVPSASSVIVVSLNWIRPRAAVGAVGRVRATVNVDAAGITPSP